MNGRKLPASLLIPGYEIGEELGRGGFAVVFAARDLAFNRKVAIKVLQTFDDVALARFERERFAVGAVSSHPNIVDVYGSGFDGLGRPFLVMEHMTGGSLGQRIRRRGATGWEWAVDAGVKLAGALETAHRAGILHRDVKPENILISAYGEPQLADFGISRNEMSGHQTVGVVPFTPLYAAPEVLSGRPASPISEVYSLGAALFAAIAGRAAFEPVTEEHVLAVLHRVANDPPPDLRTFGAPESVSVVIERAMAKDPMNRQRSAEELGTELCAAQQRLGVAPTRMHVMVDYPGSSSTFATPDAPRSRPVGARPGARLSSRPLHLIWIVDTSESMGAAGKMDALNIAIQRALSSLREVAAQNPHAQLLTRCLAFSTGVQWVIATPTPVDAVPSLKLRAGGDTDMGAALGEVAMQMRVPPMEPRSLPPVLVLVSDGRPTDDFSSGLRMLMSEPWGAKAIRLSIAIGSDADHNVLSRFIGDPGVEPFHARNAAELLQVVQWTSTVASRAASSPIGDAHIDDLSRLRPPTIWNIAEEEATSW